MAEVLLDTSAIFALLNRDDPHHARAVTIHQSLIHRQAVLVLPNFLLAESHAIINKRLGSRAARDFLQGALRDFEIQRVTLEDEWAAQGILQNVTRSKALSYFDAVAVALAERLGISEVFTFDKHFRLMGLKPVTAQTMTLEPVPPS